MNSIKLCTGYVKSETFNENLTDYCTADNLLFSDVPYFVLRYSKFLMKLDVRCRVSFNNSPQMSPASRVWVGLRRNHTYLMEEGGLGMHTDRKCPGECTNQTKRK
jgi:hypothetical protein